MKRFPIARAVVLAALLLQFGPSRLKADPPLVPAQSAELVELPLADVKPADTVHIVPQPQATMISRRQPDGTDLLIYTGGVYVYQRVSDKTKPAETYFLEIQADNAVVFYSQERLLQPDPNDPTGGLDGIYLEGDVICQTGQNRITTEQLYYDFTRSRALVINATLRILSSPTDPPIYIKAQRVRQLGQNHFSASDLKISTDEFYHPHVWIGAKEAEIQAQQQDFRYELENVTLNVGDLPVFWWPRIIGTSTMPEAPLNALHTHSSSERGYGIEIEWPLADPLHLPEGQKVETTLHIDAYSKRGVGVGLDQDYRGHEYFGSLRSYLIDDKGQDRLSRFDSRRRVTPSSDLRGRVQWRHRHYLPKGFQATFEISKLSDPDFLESWVKTEINTDKEQETIVYLKQQQDHWAIDFLSKWHLNDFALTRTELPAVGFHLAGQDLFGILTYYQDSRVSRMGRRIGQRNVPGFSGVIEPSILPGLIDEEEFTFGVSRHALVLPLHIGPWHITPESIATVVYDDSGLDTTIKNSALQIASGLRAATQFQYIDKSVHSRLWNLDQLRHIVIPEISAFWTDSDQPDVPEQDVLHFLIKQRWQTKRGKPGQKHSVDFLRINTSLTLVNNDVDNVDIPNKFFFSSPEMLFDKPLRLINDDLVNLGLATTERINQNLADHADINCSWLISDQTRFVGDLNYNLHDDHVSQASAALAIQRSPRTSYYLESLFLNNGDVIEKIDSGGNNFFAPLDGHFLTGGFSYQLNPKYTIALSHQIDIERGSTARSQAVIIRKFPRWYGAFGFDMDPIRDNVSFSITFWPEGFDLFALGTRRYSRLLR